MRIQVEHTDTFGGEANYSWVNRVEFTVPDEASDLQIVRRAKAELGLTGVACKRNDLGDAIELRPIGYAQVVFIDVV